jgi:hypothetical protein
LSNVHQIHEEPEPDIVAVLLARVIAMAPGFSAALASQIEQDMRAEFGGLRVRIPKRGKYLTPEQRQELFVDGLSKMSNEEIVTKHKISMSTLKRQMKRGGRFQNS